MSIQQVGLVPDSTHIEFDKRQQEMLKIGDGIIVEGRLAGWLAKGLNDVFKVFSFSPLDVRIERYMRREGCPHEKALEEIQVRDRHDVERYKDVYGIDDYRSPFSYDFCIDTSLGEPAELAKTIIEAMQQADPAKRIGLGRS